MGDYNYTNELRNIDSKMGAVRRQLSIQNLLKIAELISPRDALQNEEGVKSLLSRAKKLLEDWSSKN